MSKQHTGPRRVDSRALALSRRQQKRARGRQRQIETNAPGISTAPRRPIVGEVMADASATLESAPEPAVTTSPAVASAPGAARDDASAALVSKNAADGVVAPETVDPLQADPRPDASGHKHPTLAIMAAIAERGGASGPLSTSRAHIPVPTTNQAAPRPVIPAAPEMVATPVTPRTRPGMDISLRTLDRAAVRFDASHPAAPRPFDPAASSAARMPRHRPFPALDPLLPVTGVHAALAAVAALTGALLMLAGNALAIALLAFAALAGCSAGLTYLLDQQRARRAVIGSILACAQIGMLGWVLVLIGPRAVLLAGVPALTIVMGRIFGRARAQLQAIVLLLVYGASALLASTGRVAPLLAVRGSAATGLDAALALLGALLSLAALSGVLVGHERALALARAREFDARTLRETLARERAQVDADAEAIRMALNGAMRRRVVFPLSVAGPLGLLATTGNRVVERLAVLHGECEERANLEDALRRLTRALERSWLGLPEAWPEQTGTPVDEVVALLRAPRPADTPSWPSDAPTLISLLSLRRAREQASALAAASAASVGARASRRASTLAEVTPPQSGAASSRWTVHEADEAADESAERDTDEPRTS